MSSAVSTSSPAAPAVERPSVSSGTLWSGRILSILVVLFLLFDGITKVMKISAVLAASVQLVISETVIAALGVTLLVCAILHVIPRTSILGSLLLTGSLGGAASALQPNADPGLLWRAGVAWTVSPRSPLARADSVAKWI